MPATRLRSARFFGHLLPLLTLSHLIGCAKGGAERPEPSALDSLVVPTLSREPLDVDAAVPESESNRLAREHAPTTEALDDVPKALRCEGQPGERVLRRLNGREYDNTVRDLVGDDSGPSQAFPEDSFGDSFDNNAEALSISPLLFEGYQAAAEALAEKALGEDSPARAVLLGCDPARVGARDCAMSSLSEFLGRAFRRPLLDAEVLPYVELLLEARNEGLEYEAAMQVAVEAAFLSPNFLYQIERDGDPESSEAHRLDGYEVASRLSYGLWSSMPDDELFRAAAVGELDTAEGVKEQALRMLADPRSEALLTAFAGQWLEVNDISRVNQPAADVFPEYTDELKAALETETRLFMRDILTGETPFSELLTADYTYVNDVLAEHYGLEGDFDSTFVRASLEDSERRGLLSQGSILTATSAPTRVSEVRRGVFVLANLLCSPPPPPPANVQGNLDAPADAGVAALPLSERLALHSTDPSCAGCHKLMDPIGLGLENYDAIGRFRTEDQGKPIEAQGEVFIDGEARSFSGPVELGELLSEDPRLARCATQKILSFMLAREVERTGDDACRVDALLDAFSDAEFDFKSLITQVVQTDSFRSRNPGTSAEADETQEN